MKSEALPSLARRKIVEVIFLGAKLIWQSKQSPQYNDVFACLPSQINKPQACQEAWCCKGQNWQLLFLPLSNQAFLRNYQLQGDQDRSMVCTHWFNFRAGNRCQKIKQRRQWLEDTGGQKEKSDGKSGKLFYNTIQQFREVLSAEQTEHVLSAALMLRVRDVVRRGEAHAHCYHKDGWFMWRKD